MLDRSSSKPKKVTAAFLGKPGFVGLIVKDLANNCTVLGDLVLAHGSRPHTFWALNTWYEPTIADFQSVSEAAKLLRARQRNWACYSYQLHRRAKLIQEQLPHVSSKPLKFPGSLPESPLGSWTLLGPQTLLFAEHCSSAFANGEIKFLEDPRPPSRAYLKLWEALLYFPEKMRPKERVLELGASPGGWTWVARSSGAEVLAVDRSPLDPRLMGDPGVNFQKGDIFSLKPGFAEFDWLLSDAAAKPAKIYPWIKSWIESGKAGKIVCTLKFEHSDPAQLAVLKEIQKIKGSRIKHLWFNKHELSWLWQRD